MFASRTGRVSLVPQRHGMDGTRPDQATAGRPGREAREGAHDATYPGRRPLLAGRALRQKERPRSDPPRLQPCPQQSGEQDGTWPMKPFDSAASQARASKQSESIFTTTHNHTHNNVHTPPAHFLPSFLGPIRFWMKPTHDRPSSCPQSHPSAAMEAHQVTSCLHEAKKNE